MSTRALPVLDAVGIITVGRLSKSERGETECFPDLINDDFDVLDLDLGVVKRVDKLLFLEWPEVEGVYSRRGQRWRED